MVRLQPLLPQAEELGPPEVTEQQLRELEVLACGPSGAGQLAESTSIEASSLTRICDRLAAKGLIARRGHGQLGDGVDGLDRRVTTIELSACGTALVNTVTEARRARLLEIVKNVPASRRSALLAALRAFGEAAKTER